MGVTNHQQFPELKLHSMINASNNGMSIMNCPYAIFRGKALLNFRRETVEGKDRNSIQHAHRAICMMSRASIIIPNVVS